MILDPLNDAECLGKATDMVREMVAANDPIFVSLAEQFSTTDQLVDWIRSLPQRDDIGDPTDGPKVDACDPPQRLIFDTKQPNCFERTWIYNGVAELIDPTKERSAITVMTDQGPHTFPVEDGDPVVLDPRQRRNALRAALFKATRTRNGTARVSMTPTQAVDWIASLAHEPAQFFRNGERRVRNGHRALRGVLDGRPLRVAELRDVVFVLALAERESVLFGAPGRCIVATTARAVDKLDQDAARRAVPAPRNAGVELRLGRTRVRPDMRVLSGLARVGGRLGYQAGLAALRVKMASLGVTAPVLSAFERELNREGLSLGPLATPPPMVGTLAAVTPTAIAGRWLANKV